jgi:hypothetical protein
MGKFGAATVLSPFYKNEAGMPAVYQWSPGKVAPGGSLLPQYEKEIPAPVRYIGEAVTNPLTWVLPAEMGLPAWRALGAKAGMSAGEKLLLGAGRAAVAPLAGVEKGSQLATEALVKALPKAKAAIKTPQKGGVEIPFGPKGEPAKPLPGQTELAKTEVPPAIAKPAEVPPSKPPEPPVDVNQTADDFINDFGKYVTGKQSRMDWEATQQLRHSANMAKAQNYLDAIAQGRAKGLSPSQYLAEADKALGGELPKSATNIYVPPDKRDPFYQKIIDVIMEDNSIPPANKAFEIKSTQTAMDKFLDGWPIPEIPGIKGGSAKTRLLRVFKDNAEVKDAILHPPLAEPTQLDPALLAYLRNLPTDGAQLALIPSSNRAIVVGKLKTLGLNIVDLLGIPKALKFAFDVSIQGRQLGISGALHPVSWARTFPRYLKAMKSETVALDLDNWVRTQPDRMAAIHKLGLDLYDVKPGATYWERPESMASKFAEKHIPGIRASNRGAAVAVNFYMSDVGVTVTKALDLAKATDAEYKAMGSLINELVGRGEMPNFMKGTAGDIANKLMSSPRFFVSRFEWPTKILSQYKSVRMEAAKTLVVWSSMGASVLGAAKAMGASVELDPRSPEAYKIRIGNKRIDIWVGYAQILRLAAQLAPYVDEDGKVDWAMGSRKTADGKIVPIPRSQVLGRYAQSKESPGVGALVSLAEGKNYTGESLDLASWRGAGKFAIETFAPATLQEIGDAYALEGLGSAALSGLGAVGVGVSTYDSGLQSANSGISNRKTPLKSAIPSQKTPLGAGAGTSNRRTPLK